jgi:hypothetical protein
MGLRINAGGQIFALVIINLRKLEDGSLYGNAITNNGSSFEINIQEGMDSTTIIPDYLNANPGQAVIS